MTTTDQPPATAPEPEPVRLGRNGKPKGMPGCPKGKRATKAEFDERVEFTARMLAKLLYPHEVKRGFVQKFGEMGGRNIEIYISHAKKLLQKQARMTPEAAKDLAITVLLDVMRSGKPSEKTGAARLWCEIHPGIIAPVKLEHTGADGQPLVTHTVVLVSNEEMPKPKQVTNG